MSHDHLKNFIDGAFEHASDINPDTKGVVRDGVEEVLDLLDKGELRVAEKVNGDWVVQSMGEEGHPALIQAERTEADGRRSRWLVLVGQGAGEVREVEGQGL